MRSPFALADEVPVQSTIGYPEGAAAPAGHEMKSTRKRLAFLRGVEKSKHSVRIYEPTRHAVYQRDGHCCAYCGKVDVTGMGVGLTIDHIDARAGGGAAHDPHNMVTACLICNSAKQDKTARQWSAYAKSKGPPPSTSIDWSKLRRIASKSVDMAEGARLAGLAAAFRERFGGKRGVSLSRAVAEHMHSMAEPSQGPGVHRDEHGRFAPA